MSLGFNPLVAQKGANDNCGRTVEVGGDLMGRGFPNGSPRLDSASASASAFPLPHQQRCRRRVSGNAGRRSRWKGHVSRIDHLFHSRFCLSPWPGFFFWGCADVVNRSTRSRNACGRWRWHGRSKGHGRGCWNHMWQG
jgi:hypothetical protein